MADSKPLLSITLALSSQLRSLKWNQRPLISAGLTGGVVVVGGGVVVVVGGGGGVVVVRGGEGGEKVGGGGEIGEVVEIVGEG
jgi:hypothetical protein